MATAFGANLPQPLTALVGREADVAMVRARLLDEGVRLLTLTGPPGVGKTRLAIEVAAGLREHFSDGVALVELAPLLTAEAVLPAIARALGMQDVEGIPPLEALQERLRSRHVLLVLDNLEHVLAAAPGIAALLESCPRLTALVTSRAALRVRGEREFVVAPLALPLVVESSGESDGRGAEGGFETRPYASPAVALFVERAAAVRPGFARTVENAATIAEICRRLDGLPLALELAAARVRVLSPDALLSRLASRLSLLTEGARDLPARQQTLRGAIAWSYELLTPAEQALFRQLAVFVGGCTLDAATAVCDADGNLGPEVLEGVTSLLDKSLLTQSEGPDGEPRFGMLETVREFALVALDAADESDILRRRHAEYCASLAAEAKAGFASADARAWLLRLDGELHNLRSALDWCLAEDEIELATGVLEPIRVYWQARGLVGEARRWAEELLGPPESGTRPASRARLLRIAGVMAQIQGDMTTARERLAESVAIWRELDDPAGLAESLLPLGWVLTE
ncbi:MAG: ATP-binding protein, partial [Dehalococcoidia bacterium]